MRKKYINIFFIYIFIILMVLCKFGYGNPSDSFQGSRTVYDPTDSVLDEDPPSIFEDSLSSLNSGRKKWEIKYLSREDARKLMLGAKEVKDRELQQPIKELQKSQTSTQNFEHSTQYQSSNADDLSNQRHFQQSEQQEQQQFQRSQQQQQQQLQLSQQQQQHVQQSQNIQKHPQHSPKLHQSRQPPYQSQHSHEEQHQYQGQQYQPQAQKQLEQQNEHTTQTPPQLETPPFLNRPEPRKISISDERSIIIQSKRNKLSNIQSLLTKSENNQIPNRKMSKITFIHPDDLESTMSSATKSAQSSSTKTSTQITADMNKITSTEIYTKSSSLTTMKNEQGTSPTEGMEVISSTSDDRLALLEGSNRPQLIFLADDPEAASRIPELLTTLYDVSPTTRRIKSGFYGGHSDIITESNQDDLGNMTPNPSKSIHLTPVREKGERERNLEEEFFLRHGHLPPKYRPNYGSPFPQGHTGHPLGHSKVKLKNFIRVVNVEAECQDDYMRIHIRFNGSFDGLVYSSGYSHDLDCVYINGSGRNTYEFFIKLNRCGTLGSNQLEDNRKPMHKNVMWNTLTVQYNPLIEEEWDEHFKVTCEYGLEIWKTVTFPFLDVE
ncbi:UNVERIFIED_CONTAM: hypothetical protein RMT77_018673 [Armadillidium vulgare]